MFSITKSKTLFKNIKASKKAPPKKKKQTIFNVKTKILKCPDCLMEYTQEPADKALHQKFHKQNEQKFSFNSTKDIIKVGPDQVKEMISIVNNELGGSHLSQNELLQCQIFIKLDNKKIQGMIITRKISRAYRAITENKSFDTGTPVVQDNISLDTRKISDTPVLGNITLDMNKPVKCMVGVSRIWTRKEFRGKGVARKLLDHVCKEFYFGLPLSRDNIAFSQPTDMGHELALKFFGRNDFLVYVE
jgi:N-acetyltransferase